MRIIQNGYNQQSNAHDQAEFLICTHNYHPLRRILGTGGSSSSGYPGKYIIFYYSKELSKRNPQSCHSGDFKLCTYKAIISFACTYYSICTKQSQVYANSVKIICTQKVRTYPICVPKSGTLFSIIFSIYFKINDYCAFGSFEQ